MVGDKLNSLKQEILKYVGLPYFSNVGRYKNQGENSQVGKGTAKEIALETIRLANAESVQLTDMSPKDIYKFQKKHHLGIDCSGLACHLVNHFFQGNLNPRRTSADMLTSAPISKKIKPASAGTGDLVRQKNGHHVLFIIEKLGNEIFYVDSSIARQGVRYGQVNLNDPQFKYDGFYRVISPQVVPDKSVG